MRDSAARLRDCLLLFTVSSLFSIVGGEAGREQGLPCSGFEPERCRCSKDLKEFYCRTAGFERVPGTLPAFVNKLDLTSNNISVINETSMARYPLLEELILSDNNLEFIHPNSFSKNLFLKRLLLQGCGLKEIPSEALTPLGKLQTLQIGNNDVRRVEKGAFGGAATSLRSLRLDANRLGVVPFDAMAELAHLEVLNIGNNLIKSLASDAFPVMENLIVL
ncbi:unnamed protein product [Phaedon cochleariae]|uniref:Uncharacterized protein n=1 Tax=Phaedon cochleariae TaxID=80249 RepID=A0A9P0DJC5_PHACE|nr:unnamed protein product [Phaedon cochleariae]